MAGRFCTTGEAHARFGRKIDFLGPASTFLICLQSWKESQHRYLTVLISLGRLSVPGGSVVRIYLPRQEAWVHSLGWDDLLQKEMATPLQFSSLENSMARRPWWATVHGMAELDTSEQLDNPL